MNAEFTIKNLEAENQGLRSKLQAQELEIEELRRVALALVVEIERQAEEGLADGFIDILEIERQLIEAREVLARAGLL